MAAVIDDVVRRHRTCHRCSRACSAEKGKWMPASTGMTRQSLAGMFSGKDGSPYPEASMTAPRQRR